MIKNMWCVVVITFIFSSFIEVNSQGDPRCVPISRCPSAKALIERNSRNPNQDTVMIFRSAHCGYDREAKVYCDILEKALQDLDGNQDNDSSCIPISQCSVAMDLIKTRQDQQVISTLQKAHCGYDREALVDCRFIENSLPDNRLVGKDPRDCIPIAQCPSTKELLMSGKDMTQIVGSLGNSYCGLVNTVMMVRCTEFKAPTITKTNTRLPVPETFECGIQSTSGRIFGGNATALDDFPWLAILYYKHEAKGKLFGCHGTLISSRHILTAAHCLDDSVLKANDMGPLYSVVLGEYDTRTEKDCIEIEGSLDCAPPAKEYTFDRYVIHPRFSLKDGMNDIALVKLSQDVEYTEFIKPICLPSKSFRLVGDEVYWVSGWGKTETVKTSPVKLKAQVSHVSKQECNADWDRQLGNNVVCAGRGDGNDTCKGDSGGPLMLQKTINNEFVTFEIGIVSFGHGRCGSGPAVYTYVPNFLDWIKQNL